MKPIFSTDFSTIRIPKSSTHALEKRFENPHFIRYKQIPFNPTQTKILEGGTKDKMRIFEALFKGVSTQFGP